MLAAKTRVFAISIVLRNLACAVINMRSQITALQISPPFLTRLVRFEGRLPRHLYDIFAVPGYQTCPTNIRKGIDQHRCPSNNRPKKKAAKTAALQFLSYVHVRQPKPRSTPNEYLDRVTERSHASRARAKGTHQDEYARWCPLQRLRTPRIPAHGYACNR